MPTITFLSPDGRSDSFEGASGTSLMQLAVSNGVEGIVAECGGSAMCATCHVYVDPAFADRLPPPNAVEDEMLNSTADERRANSRLSCQVLLAPELDGMVVRLPANQT